MTVDPSTSQPAAKLFYVAFTADGATTADRPVTFFYNGGPGSASVFVLLGSFGPQRLRTALPSFTPPAPYTMEPNPDTILDRTDLVFINPVGTGYSAAVAPHRNRDFWGVDQDAGSLRQFIKRYLTRYDRWNSPKFLFGESYGTARSCVLGYLLHEDGVDLNGITLLSSILDYSQAGNPVGLLPTLAADAWYHKKVDVNPPPADLAAFENVVVPFAHNEYAALLAAFPAADPATVQKLSDYTGIPTIVLTSWEGFNVSDTNNLGTLHFLIALLQAEGKVIGAYDGRATGVDTGIAATISPLSGGNDATMAAVNGAYTAMWNTYLNESLKFTSTSAFTDLNDQAFRNWDFGHIDPTGAQKGKDVNGNTVLYTAGDPGGTDGHQCRPEGAVGERLLRLGDALLPDHHRSAEYAPGRRDGPPESDRQVLPVRAHGLPRRPSRTAMKADLAALYDSALSNRPAVTRIRALQQARRAQIER